MELDLVILLLVVIVLLQFNQWILAGRIHSKVTDIQERLAKLEEASSTPVVTLDGDMMAVADSLKYVDPDATQIIERIAA